MTWAVHGMMVIPANPQLQINQARGGSFFNFKAVTQGKKDTEGKAEYQYWDCSLFVPENILDQWTKDLQPGHIFYVEAGTIESVPILEGKHHKTKVRLDPYKTKHLITPLWTEKKE